MKTLFARHISYQNAITLLAAILCGWLLVSLTNSTYPLAGADYRYFLPRITDTYFHFIVNGLGIQWYTPSFGGGLPAYPNPQHIQYSITQFFTLITHPWEAILASVFTYTILGFSGMYLTCRHVLKLGWATSLLAACLFSVNGFYIQRAGIGHLGFFSFPLVTLLLFLLLKTSKSWEKDAYLLGILIAAVIHTAGFYTLVVILLSLPASLALINMVRELDWKEIFKRTVVAVFLATGLTVSKIYAVLSLMRFLPREVETTALADFPVAIRGLAYQLLGSMNIVPLANWIGMKPTFIRDWLQAWTGSTAGVWELDISLSPVLWLTLIFGGANLGIEVIRNPRKVFLHPYRWLAAIFLLFFVYLIIEFTLAQGIFYPTLHELPILKSLHVNSRYASALILPLVLLAAYLFNRMITKLPERAVLIFTLALAGMVIASGLVYFWMPLERLQDRFYYAKGMQDIYETHQASSDLFVVEKIISDLEEPRVFDERATSLRVYEPLFGYTAAQFQPQLVDGSVWLEQDGYFNMTNPSSLVYPEVNNNSPFERIPVSQRQQLDDFVNRKQPAWNLPPAQHAANLVSFLSLLVLPILFLLPEK